MRTQVRDAVPTPTSSPQIHISFSPRADYYISDTPTPPRVPSHLAPYVAVVSHSIAATPMRLLLRCDIMRVKLCADCS